MEDEFCKSLLALKEEHAQLGGQLSDPSVHTNGQLAKKINRRYLELSKIIAEYTKYQKLLGDLQAATELAKEDASFAQEADNLLEPLEAQKIALRRLLIPKDPDDDRDIIMEIKSGEGGAESALFAADLLKMYSYYAQSCGWTVEILSKAESDLGGYKDIQLAIKAQAADCVGVWSRLKYEGGVHRVQRVPVTESQGRIHTSTTGVLVFPEVDEPQEIQIDPQDIKVDVYRSSGPGGQSVNTTDSAVRITHIPTGIIVSMQNEKSQLQNKIAAMRVLQARLLAKQKEEKAAADADARYSQIRSMERSERIRTYNFPENRITDHRTGYKAYNLDVVLAGDLGPVIDSAIKLDEQMRLQNLPAAS